VPLLLCPITWQCDYVSTQHVAFIFFLERGTHGSCNEECMSLHVASVLPFGNQMNASGDLVCVHLLFEAVGVPMAHPTNGCP
jgi:hypothetical protein